MARWVLFTTHKARAICLLNHPALDIASQIANAMQHAHSKLAVHRDLKPDNIMLTDDLESPSVKSKEENCSKQSKSVYRNAR
jgi:serine/threonine protein kinase